MRKFSHWTPRYIVNRLQLMAYAGRYPDLPWLTQAMNDFLASWLKPTDRGAEFGSGRSTIWFARRIAHLTSVEHDTAWHAEVSGRLQAQALHQRIDYLFAAQEEQYVAAARGLAPASLDFCLVDGICRDRCALACIDKLKPGGALIVDNINWYLPHSPKSRAPASRGPGDTCESPDWETFAQTVANWRCFWTSNGITDTAAWFKPL